jgi:hypothetical protein
MDRKDSHRLPRSLQIAPDSATQVVRGAYLPDSMPVPKKGRRCLWDSPGCIDSTIDGLDLFRNSGLASVDPFVLPSGIPNLAGFIIVNDSSAWVRIQRL